LLDAGYWLKSELDCLHRHCERSEAIFYHFIFILFLLSFVFIKTALPDPEGQFPFL
jgi:hypothetical protein